MNQPMTAEEEKDEVEGQGQGHGGHGHGGIDNSSLHQLLIIEN